MKKSSIVKLCGRHRSIVSSANDFGVYYPLSYYINGGTDITGEALQETGELSYETEDMIATAGTPDSRTDPRVSKWDVIEQIGIEAYESTVDKALTQSSPKGE